jgi:superfamily II DNA helicase RecQ
MKHKFFKIPVSDPVNGEIELNTFVSQHRIAHIDRHFVADGANSFWSICLIWLEGEGALADSVTKRKNKIDYREVLNETDFAVYAQLRDLRKNLAEQEATPVYNIFTNEQLASIVQQRIVTKSALLAVEGIGQTRVDKYGDIFMNIIKSSFQSSVLNETNTDHP